MREFRRVQEEMETFYLALEGMRPRGCGKQTTLYFYQEKTVQIPRSLVKFVPHCAKESTRYVMNHVKIDRTQQCCRACATDGKRMLICEWQDCNSGEMTLLLSQDSLKKIENMPKTPRKRKAPAANHLRIAEDKVNGGVTVNSGVSEITVPVEEGQFPDYLGVTSTLRIDGPSVAVPLVHLLEAVQGLQYMATDSCVDCPIVKLSISRNYGLVISLYHLPGMAPPEIKAAAIICDIPDKHAEQEAAWLPKKQL